MKTDTTIATIIILSMIAAVIWILQPVYGYEPYQVKKPTWDMPEIPYCEKELWLRIKDGCDEDKHND